MFGPETTRFFLIEIKDSFTSVVLVLLLFLFIFVIIILNSITISTVCTVYVLYPSLHLCKHNTDKYIQVLFIFTVPVNNFHYIRNIIFFKK